MMLDTVDNGYWILVHANEDGQNYGYAAESGAKTLAILLFPLALELFVQLCEIFKLNFL
jgi:hypothetical protein